MARRVGRLVTLALLAVALRPQAFAAPGDRRMPFAVPPKRPPAVGFEGSTRGPGSRP